MKRLDSIKFQRMLNGDYEDGFLIDEGFGKIIDSNGNVLDEVFYYIRTSQFNIDVNYYKDNKELIEKILKM